MRRLAGLIGIAVLVLAVGVAVTTAADKRGSKTVSVGDNFFNPNKLTVSKGTKVKFKWIGDDSHNVVKKSGPGGDFSSPITDDRGVNLTHKFSKSGTYKLICTVHEDMKMKVNVKR